MTEKRYYQKEYEESYYIFDSKTLSEEEFDEKIEYEGYEVFADSLTSEEIIELLNENDLLHQTIKAAIQNERTDLGKSVLTQLAENLEVEL